MRRPKQAVDTRHKAIKGHTSIRRKNSMMVNLKMAISSRKGRARISLKSRIQMLANLRRINANRKQTVNIKKRK